MTTDKTYTNDIIYIEKKEKIRLIIQQKIGLGRVLDCIRKEFKINEFEKNDEIVLIIEEKDEK